MYIWTHARRWSGRTGSRAWCQSGPRSGSSLCVVQFVQLFSRVCVRVCECARKGNVFRPVKRARVHTTQHDPHTRGNLRLRRVVRRDVVAVIVVVVGAPLVGDGLHPPVEGDGQLWLCLCMYTCMCWRSRDSMPCACEKSRHKASNPPPPKKTHTRSAPTNLEQVLAPQLVQGARGNRQHALLGVLPVGEIAVRVHPVLRAGVLCVWGGGLVVGLMGDCVSVGRWQLCCVMVCILSTDPTETKAI